MAIIGNLEPKPETEVTKTLQLASELLPILVPCRT